MSIKDLYWLLVESQKIAQKADAFTKVYRKKILFMKFPTNWRKNAELFEHVFTNVSNFIRCKCLKTSQEQSPIFVDSMHAQTISLPMVRFLPFQVSTAVANSSIARNTGKVFGRQRHGLEFTFL